MVVMVSWNHGFSSLAENLGESPTSMSCPKAQAYLCYDNVPNTPASSHLIDHEEKEKRFGLVYSKSMD